MNTYTIKIISTDVYDIGGGILKLKEPKRIKFYRKTDLEAIIKFQNFTKTNGNNYLSLIRMSGKKEVIALYNPYNKLTKSILKKQQTT